MQVADIAEVIMIGIDIMNSRRFQLNFKHGTLMIDNEELIPHTKLEKRASNRKFLGSVLV